MESSAFLTNNILENIDFQNEICIVEIGAGTGVFTKKIMEKLPKGATIIIFELNQKFASLLEKKYPNVIVINDSIENIKKYAVLFPFGKVDYFISSLPLTLITNSKLKKLFASIRNYLTNEGSFIQYQYSLNSKNLIKEYFKTIKTKFVFLNLPPAFVYVAKK